MLSVVGILMLLGGEPPPKGDRCVEAKPDALAKAAFEAAGGADALSRIETEDYKCKGFLRERAGDRRYVSRQRAHRARAHRTDMTWEAPAHVLRHVVTPEDAFAFLDERPVPITDLAEQIARMRAAPRITPILNLQFRLARGDRVRAWRGCTQLGRPADVIELCQGSRCEKDYLDPKTHLLFAVDTGKALVSLHLPERVEGIVVPTRYEAHEHDSGKITQLSCEVHLNLPLPPLVFSR